MAVPRPVLLALVGLGLLASVFLVTRSGTNEAVTGSANPAAKPAVSPSAPAQAKTRKAEAEKAVAPERDKADRKQGPAKKAAAPKPAAAAKSPESALEARVQAAALALGQNKAVVFFFTKPGAADDVGARIAVQSLRKMQNVEIFDANLDEVAAYRPMLSNVGISQIPSTVIVRPGRKAVLLQGFVDAGTLRQNVADALR
jgi:hypothetical protein